MTNRTSTDATVKTLQECLQIARDSGHALAEPIHLAAALFTGDESVGSSIVARADASSQPLSSKSRGDAGLDVREVRRAIQRAILKKASQVPAHTEASVGSSLQKVISTLLAKANGDAFVALDHLLVAIYDDRATKDVLESAGLTKRIVVKTTEEMRGVIW